MFGIKHWSTMVATMIAVAGCKTSVPTEGQVMGAGVRKDSGPYVGHATRFTDVSPEGSGCGTPPDLMWSESGGRFVALNVQDTPQDYKTFYQRPINGPAAGVWNNGKNCGRWIKVTIEDECSGMNDGTPHQDFCRGGKGYVADDANGATAYFLVSDSCHDGNAWCRDDKYHLDLSEKGTTQFSKDGKPVTFSRWSNRKVSWEFVKAPQYRGDLRIGFVRGNFSKGREGAWISIIIANLPNGIGRVEAKAADGAGPYTDLKMVSDNGQKFDGFPPSKANEWLIRVYDVEGSLVEIGGKSVYKIKFPCADRCPDLFNEAKYTKI